MVRKFIQLQLGLFRFDLITLIRLLDNVYNLYRYALDLNVRLYKISFISQGYPPESKFQSTLKPQNLE